MTQPDEARRQYGCGGKHHGIGSAECPRELHHHHDEFCKPPDRVCRICHRGYIGQHECSLDELQARVDELQSYIAARLARLAAVPMVEES